MKEPSTRYFVDTEFVDDGHTIDLISIGLVCEDGRELYLQSADFDPMRASPWVREHVIDHLALCPHMHRHGIDIPLADCDAHKYKGQCTFTRPAQGITGIRGVRMPVAQLIGAYTDCLWRTREQIRNELLAFMDVEKYGKPEWWGWCGSYDYVSLCQLFGTMMDLPPGWPHYIHEFQQILDERGIEDSDLPAQEEGLHNALADARHLKRLWRYVVGNDAWQ